MTPTDRSVYRQIAAELADEADAQAATRHPHLGKAAAELGLVYLQFETAPLANDHVAKTWEAAEAARGGLMYADAVSA